MTGEMLGYGYALNVDHIRAYWRVRNDPQPVLRACNRFMLRYYVRQERRRRRAAEQLAFSIR